MRILTQSRGLVTIVTNMPGDIGGRVRQLRIEHGWTLGQLAHRADIDHSHLSMIESGRRNPKLPTLEKIAAALGVPVATLLQVEEPAENFAATDPDLSGVQVNAKRLKELDPESFKIVERIVQSMLREAEELDRERRHANRK